MTTMGKKLETIKDSASVQETAKKLKDKGGQFFDSG